MDTRDVVARFEAERQALALMDHRNIARVLDGGESASGRPYFLMDPVKGIPITRFCDEHQLTSRAGGPVCGRLPGRAARSSERHYPSGSEADQRPRRPLRRRAGAQADRLWRGEGAGPATNGADLGDRLRQHRRHVGAVIRSTDQSPGAAQQADAEADRAMAWLKQVAAAGYNHAAHIMQHDEKLDALRRRADFQQVLADLEAGEKSK